MNQYARSASFSIALLIAFCAPPLGAVVINEIHYDPVEGSDIEFIELYNPSLAGVSMAGWRFSSGLQFTLPEGASIPGRGFAVIARNPAALMDRFRIVADRDRIFGPYVSHLDNKGEKIVLADSSGTLVDAVDYDDLAPWPDGADGHGGSLERVCHRGDPLLPSNWRSDVEHGPSPMRPNTLVECPPPVLATPEVAINEIYYHPVSDADATQEYVELLNTTDRPIDLTGYQFGQGIQFKLPDGTTMSPGGLLVVCRNLIIARAALGIEGPAVGNFTGQLDNGGERITLFDPRGEVVDSVKYGDQGSWPVAADSLGRSLERISPSAPGDDPASWSVSIDSGAARWRSASVTGIATADTLFLYLAGAGEFFVDNIVIEDPANPGVNLLSNGSFNAGIEGWTPTGNHLDSGWESAGGADGSGALRVGSKGRGTGSGAGIGFTIAPPLIRNATYKMTFAYRYLNGDRGIILRVSGASATRGLFIDLRNRPLVSPGEPNGSARAIVPPFISHVGRFPSQPRSTDETIITARVRGPGAVGEGVAGVYLHYFLNLKPEEVDIVAMRDDGLSGDGETGDGVFGARLPAFPHNTPVTFRIEAEDPSGVSRELPAPGDPTGVLGYYVNDSQPPSPLPVFHLLLNHTSPQNAVNLIRALNCDVWVNAAFAEQGDLYPSVGLRQRGQSVCNSQKPFLKVRFARGRDFEGRHKINLQSIWTDKSLVREHFAWNFFDEIDSPYCTTRFVRLHSNGQYFGLYSELEHPDADFLARVGLNPSGNLYKAVASREERMTDYRSGYEKKTNEDGDFSDLKAFLDTMNATPRASLRAFWEKNVVPDSLIDYQAVQVLTNNRDYPHKNHYLYHDTADGRWRTISWDMDLTFGKFWDGGNGGVLNDLMDVPGISPWYTTRVAGEGIGNYLLDRFFYDTPDRYYQRALRVRLWIALKEKLTPALMENKIVAARDLLMDEQAEDMRKWSRSAPTPNDRTAPRDFLPNLDRVRAHVKSRQTFLTNYLKNTDRLPAPDQLKITEVLYHPSGKDEEMEFVELWNNTGKEIDISGWTVSGLGQGYQFPPETKAAAGEVVVVARSPTQLKAQFPGEYRIFGPYEGELDNRAAEVRVRDAGPGYPATIDVVRYRNSPPWPSAADELGHSMELTGVAPDKDNDYAHQWRASVLPGGTPGRVPGLAPSVPFRRGNCNGDAGGRVNISDAIYLLGVFFYGLDVPRCADGCDASGDRQLDITDAIVLLRYLFLHENTIPAPGPTACGTAEASYCEETNCPAGG